MEECISKIVKPNIESLSSVSISFDLWMNRGCEDIFDAIVHGIENFFSIEVCVVG